MRGGIHDVVIAILKATRRDHVVCAHLVCQIHRPIDGAPGTPDPSALVFAHAGRASAGQDDGTQRFDVWSGHRNHQL